jgi:uncharacterized repeat protein (TIGR03837 family)
MTSLATARPAPPQRWDLFCHVVDNHGDLGVCWRLARQLAGRGLAVRLFVDDASALAWMAPGTFEAAAAGTVGPAGVLVLPWVQAAAAGVQPGDVVVETFGCTLPDAFVAAMQARAVPPVWVNLEYLSAEAYVERSHLLPSPRPAGLTTWFFYPGFTARTGGLLRETGLLQAHDAMDGNAWLAAQGWPRRPGERVVSLFCYDNPCVPALLLRLAEQPTLLLATPGHAQRLVAAAAPHAATLRVQAVPWLPQDDYDRLLRACDLNFVRGEDSLVRALWAGRPFVWQIYPQHDGAHAAKLQAVLERSALPPDAAALLWAWNGLGHTGTGPLPPWPDTAAWQQACTAWRAALATQPDLVSQLVAFASGKALPDC